MIVGTLGYVALVTLLRVLGNRTLSKMNAYDWVVTFALGSILPTTMLSKDISLAEGLLAFALLMGLELAITWLSQRSSTFRDLANAEPVLLFYQGRCLLAQMHRSRLNKADIEEAVRKQGIQSLSAVEAVVLEPDGTFSVMRRRDGRDDSALDDIPRQASATR